MSENKENENEKQKPIGYITSYYPYNPNIRYYTEIYDKNIPCPHKYVPSSVNDCLFYQCVICKKIIGN